MLYVWPNVDENFDKFVKLCQYGLFRVSYFSNETSVQQRSFYRNEKEISKPSCLVLAYHLPC